MKHQVYTIVQPQWTAAANQQINVCRYHFAFISIINENLETTIDAVSKWTNPKHSQ